MSVSGSFTRLMLRYSVSFISVVYRRAGYAELRGNIDGGNVTFSLKEPQEEKQEEVSFFHVQKKVNQSKQMNTPFSYRYRANATSRARAFSIFDVFVVFDCSCFAFFLLKLRVFCSLAAPFPW